MKSVGIKVLKDKLSAYLKLVRQGETVLVTDRDEVIAEIRKPTQISRKVPNSIDSILLDLENRGVLTRPTGPASQERPSQMSLANIPRRSTDIDLETLLKDMRSDRF